MFSYFNVFNFSSVDFFNFVLYTNQSKRIIKWEKLLLSEPVE